MTYNLASERVRLGYTQKELAEKLGVTISTVSHWENDVTLMTSAAAIKAADLFGCTVDYLLGRTDVRN